MKSFFANKTTIIYAIVVFIATGFLFPFTSFSQGTCATAVLLTPGASCTGTATTTSSLTGSVSAVPAGSCGGATAATTFAQWYKFKAATTIETITLSGLGTNLSAATTYIEVLNGTCGAFSSLGCQAATSPLQVSGLTVATTYYLRVYTTIVPAATNTGFTLCVLKAPGNDNCAAASAITDNTVCTPTASTLDGASPTAGLPAGCQSAGVHYDVWYTFTASATAEFITLSGLGGLVTNPEMQLYSGACGGLVSVACGTTSLIATSLTSGNTYFLRISNVGSNPTGGGAFSVCIEKPAANDDCAGATVLTPGASCANITDNVYTSTLSAVPITPCPGPATYDLWYQFTALSTAPTITLSSIGANFTSPGIQLFSGTCAGLTAIDCGTTSLTATSLTVGSTYFIRVYSTGPMPTTATGSNFDICVVDAPPVNDDCANATYLATASGCGNTSGTLKYANPTAVPSDCGNVNSADVWYKFIPQTTTPVITLSSVGANLTAGQPVIHLLTGTCGSLTSVQCAKNVTSLSPVGLTIGQTYYIRISSNTTGTAGTTWGFKICVTENATTIDKSKSYINITKGTNGGTVDPGDTLEMRTTFVIKSNSADSLAFFDTLYHNAGFAYLPGSLSLQTNEGKLYKGFTDAVDADAGSISKTGLDTAIRINFGAGATAGARGKLLNTSKPSVFGGTCIIMVTYRVVVYGAYNTKINFKTGLLTYRDVSANVMHNVNFQADSLVVYQSPGLCPNAVSAINAIGAESNGTFGSPATAPPLARNRGTSTSTNYIYMPFTSAGGPQDYYYGVPNNTSAIYSTNQSLPKPDPVGNRVFNVWDIIGDHTNAANPAKGNPPCDVTQPVSATNPCGYMLVINSAYRADTAFQYTATNLCPNTYYEISAWFRNICYKCACDSNGNGSPYSAGYIPTALNDTSGVRPNLAFDVNGYDYYTTGNIPYYGIGQTTSDTSNKWVKKGFTYLTGPAETSIRLTIRNNAPGGGGNDWAMDDISIKNCLPNMKYSPTLNPSTCWGNPVTVNDTVQSYFNSYSGSKWQESHDNGLTWTDVSSAVTNTPILVGGNYQYVTSYTIPVASTDTLDNNDLYRVIVGTTIPNVGNTNCQLTDGISQIRLTVNNCGVPLNSQLLSFSGQLIDNYGRLSWTTLREYEALHFEIEKSKDGFSFSKIATVNGYNKMDQTNYYYFTDPELVKNKVWYRIIMINNTNNKKYSRTINLANNLASSFEIANLINPFQNELLFDVSLSEEGKIDAILSTLSGAPIKKQSFYAYGGINSFSLPNMESLTKGIYVLQLRNKEKLIIRKVIKN